MARRRRSYEPGHRPKFLVVVDETAECLRAVSFAARRAAKIGAGLVMLAVVEPEEAQAFLGVGDLIRAEAEAAAEERVDVAAETARALLGRDPEKRVITGPRAETILTVIDEDEDIAALILAAGAGGEGPGPLVAHFAHRAASLPIPMTVVPGGLSAEDFDALA